MKHPRYWKHLRLDQREFLPTASGVYAVSNWHGKIFYIGRAQNLKQRWAGKGHHRFRQANRLLGAKLFYYECSDYKEKEAQLIRQYKPAWNNTPINKKWDLPWWLVFALAGLLAQTPLAQSAIKDADYLIQNREQLFERLQNHSKK